MKKEIGIFLLAFILLGVILFWGFTTYSKKIYMSGPVTSGYSDLDIQNTTWEIVQFSDGPRIENLVGTDWIITFGKEDGFIRLCDTHTFTYDISGNTLSVIFSDKKESSCQESTVSSEVVFLNLLNAGPLVERMQFVTKDFNEVLTLVYGQKKIVLVPRTEVTLRTSQRNTQAALADITKQVMLTANILCSENRVCTSSSFEGTFLFTQISTLREGTDQVKTPALDPFPVKTSVDGTALFSLPLGTYQVTLDSISNSAYEFNPLIFSVVDSQIGLYQLPLQLVKK